MSDWEVSDKPIRIDITTVSPCPQRLKKQVVSKGKRLYKPTTPDIDNYAKYILALKRAAEEAYTTEVVDCDMVRYAIGKGKEYINKNEWLECKINEWIEKEK